MSGYAVLVRVEGVRPQRVLRGSIRPGGTTRQRPAADLDSPSQPMIDLRGAGRTISDRIERFREIWSQTTFYLFDPESWR